MVYPIQAIRAALITIFMALPKSGISHKAPKIAKLIITIKVALKIFLNIVVTS